MYAERAQRESTRMHVLPGCQVRIRGYAIIPLGPLASLIGWVHDLATLHVLVRDYRQSRMVLLNIERRLMLQVCYYVFASTSSHGLR